jgi:hypothetical protein
VLTISNEIGSGGQHPCNGAFELQGRSCAPLLDRASCVRSEGEGPSRRQ